MNLGETLYVTDRKQWRAWLAKHHKTKAEIWLVYYRKDSGKPRIPYNDAVEEALCYGWIDSTQKTVDAESTAQRFSPRRRGSPVSPMNKERIRRLIASKKMTKAGLDSIGHHLTEDLTKKSASEQLKAFQLPDDIRDALRADPAVLVLIPYEVDDDTITPVTVHAIERQQIRFRLSTGDFDMNKARMVYFQEEDIIHLVITDEPESKSIELGPNITAELNDKNELIGVEILNASAFLRDTVLESVQAKTLQLFESKTA